MEQPSVGTHYPRSTGEFQAWFRTDADCPANTRSWISTRSTHCAQTADTCP
jgi:hypothetical protein